jgi:hypothetical protein
MSSLTSTTSSAITLTNIVTGAAIAIGALMFLLALDMVMSERDSWNARTAGIVRVILLPLIMTFCAFVAFKTAQFL